MPKKKSTKRKAVGHYGHDDATRKNIPPAEMQSVARDEVKTPVQVAYERRNPDLDPQLVWRGKDDGPLNVSAPPLYIQEKVHPKALMDDLLRQSRTRAGIEDEGYHEADLFSDFNGLPDEAKSTDFYRHEGHWSNRMILGDGLQVMASLAEREGLRGKVLRCRAMGAALDHHRHLPRWALHRRIRLPAPHSQRGRKRRSDRHLGQSR